MIKHYLSPQDGSVISTYGDWCFWHDDITQDVEAGSWSFSDGVAPNNLATSPGAFVAICFHMMQQCGGRLYFLGRQCNPMRISDTSGEPVGPDQKVLWNGKILAFRELLNCVAV